MAQTRLLKVSSGTISQHDESNDSIRVVALGIGEAPPSTGVSVTGNISTSGDVIIGSNPAAAGIIRLDNATSICFNNVAGTADICALEVTSGNVVVLGDSTNSAGVVVEAKTGNNIIFQIGGGNDFIFNETRLRNNMVEYTWGSAVVSPILYQEDDTTASVTGDTLTFHSQDCTGATTIGGSFNLRPGTGTSTNGTLSLQDADGTDILTIGDNSLATFNKPIVLPEFAVASLPSVSTSGQMIAVTDETGGYVPAFSDGTNWRRVTDRAIVS